MLIAVIGMVLNALTYALAFHHTYVAFSRLYRKQPVPRHYVIIGSLAWGVIIAVTGFNHV